MADKTFYPSFTYGFARVHMDFYVVQNATITLAPAISTVVGVEQACITSITHTATGVLTWLLGPRERYAKVITASCSVEDSTNTAATVGTFLNEGSATLGISFVTNFWAAAGTAVDVPASKRIMVTLVFKNSVASNPA